MSRFHKLFLNDAVLGFLALLSLFLVFVPSVFSLSETQISSLGKFEFLVLSIFALEYLLGFVTSPEKKAFVLSKWRLLDALIIAVALVSLIPAVPDVFRNSPILRLFKLARLALLGTRTGLALRVRVDEPQGLIEGDQPTLTVTALDPTGSDFESISLLDGANRIATEGADWIFVSGISQDDIEGVSAAMALPEKVIQRLFQSTVPRFDHQEKFTTFFTRYPFQVRTGERLKRVPVLLVNQNENIIVLSSENSDLESRIRASLSTLEGTMPRMEKATIALLNEVIRGNTEVEQFIEATLFQLEVSQVNYDDETFLRKTFELRTDILRVSSSLKQNLKI